MKNIVVLLVSEFAETYPTARDHPEAIKYLVAIDHHPSSRPEPGKAIIPLGFKAVVVGYTNKTRTKTTTRFAVVPYTDADNQRVARG